MNLYVIVYEVLDGEANWCFVPDDGMDQMTAEKLAIEDYNRYANNGEDEPLAEIDDVLGSVWYEKVYVPNPYKYRLKLVKRGE